MELFSTKHTLSLPLTFILLPFSFFCLCLLLTASYLMLLTTFYLYFCQSALISVMGIEEDGLLYKHSAPMELFSTKHTLTLPLTFILSPFSAFAFF